MGTTPIIIIGAGGFGREVLGILRDVEQSQNLDLLGFIDDGQVPEEMMERCGTRHLGTTDDFSSLPAGTHYIIGIGNGAVRRRIAEKADAAGLIAHTLVHPSATFGVDVTMGAGTVICSGARISSNLTMGRHVNINPNCAIGHDSEISDFATVYPLCAISGYVKLGEASTIGATSVVNPSVSVGSEAFIASGAAVTRDVPPGTLAAGVPADVKKKL